MLLDARGEPKIADLGLSRAQRRQLLGSGVEASVRTEEARVRGTFDYLAPEIRKGEEITPASDVFALGVLAFELLMGKRPLGVFQLPRAALAKEGIEVPRALDRIVERALAHDATARYPDAAVMLADLRAGDHGLEWARETAGPSRAPRAFRVEPVNDLSFAVQIYTAFVLPILIFCLVGNGIRFHVESRPLRAALFALALGLVALASLRAFTVVRRRGPGTP